jgi:DHA1 family tetracycline resistance protein-like MFS transporter
VRKGSLVPLFLTVVIDLLGFGIVLPLLPLYGREFGASHTVIGLLFISFSGLQFLSAPLWGRLSDLIGRRPVILIGLAGSFASYALFGVAALSSTLALLFVSRSIAGIFGGTISTAYAYIADVTTTEERGRGMALIGVAFGVGFTLGPAIGGVGHWFHPAVPGAVAAAFSLTALFFAWRRLPEPERRAVRKARTWLDVRALGRAMRMPTVGLILFLAFVNVTCFALMESTAALLGRRVYHFSTLEIGLLFSSLGFWLILAQGFIVRRYMRRVGETRFVIIGAATLGLGLLGLGLADRFWMLALVSPLPVLGFGMIAPSLSSLLSRRSAADVQGGVLGVSQSLQSLARIVGPMVGLPLFGLSTGLPFFVGAAVMAVALGRAIHLATRRVADAS